MPALDDAVLSRLVEAARHGDDVALGQLVRLTQPIVWRFCANLTSHQDAEDATQEVYLRATRNIAQYRGDAPVVSWLLSIARHVSADHVRKIQRRTRLAERLRAERPATSVAPAGNEVDALVAALDPDRRIAFVLTQVLGLSYEEAAAACGCPVGTIRSRVARARADLVAAVQRAEAL
jgi:RNA polymerase sigma-70 factor (ECF subfamily)